MSMRKIAALIPVCALFAACGGEATPEAKSPDSAAATESKPADGAATTPADGAATTPADGAATEPAAGGDAKPEGEAK
jgi:hypothetical protein